MRVAAVVALSRARAPVSSLASLRGVARRALSRVSGASSPRLERLRRLRPAVPTRRLGREAGNRARWAAELLVDLGATEAEAAELLARHNDNLDAAANAWIVRQERRQRQPS